MHAEPFQTTAGGVKCVGWLLWGYWRMHCRKVVQCVQLADRLCFLRLCFKDLSWHSTARLCIMKKEIHKAYQPWHLKMNPCYLILLLPDLLLLIRVTFTVFQCSPKLSRLIYFQCSYFWFEVFWETSSVFLKAPRELFTKLQRRSHIDPLYRAVFWWCNNSSSSLWS